MHVLVSEREIRTPACLDQARTILSGSFPVALHLRARVTAAELLEVARDLAARAWVSGSWCVVNGRPDVALAASAQAVQLGRTALAPPDARRVLGSDSGVSVGVSVHSAAEAAEGVRQGADYLVAGTAYETPSHPDRPGCGPSGIRAMCESAAGVPVLAIGGVTVDRIGELVAAGASGAVVGRAVWAASDPCAAADELLAAFGR